MVPPLSPRAALPARRARLQRGPARADGSPSGRPQHAVTPGEARTPTGGPDDHLYAIEAIVALTAGTLASSTALIGFGRPHPSGRSNGAWMSRLSVAVGGSA